MFIPTFDRYVRKSISPEALTLVCDFANGNPKHPLHSLDVDWTEVLDGICQNGLIGLTFEYLQKNPSIDFPPNEFRDAVKKVYEVNALRMALMYRNIKATLEILNRSGISYLVVKGPVMGCSIYSNPNIRSFNDLDIIVHGSNWSTMHQFLIQNNFLLYFGSPEPPPPLTNQDSKQGNSYHNEQKNFLLEIHYDDILESGLVSRDLQGFWKRAISIVICSTPCKTLSLEDHLIYLAAHLHKHGYSRLIWLSDLVLFLRKNGNSINWQKIVEIVNNEEVRVPVYFTFHILEALMEVDIPHDVLDGIRPDRFRMFVHEKIWPEKKILSFEPLSPVKFSFYFKPLFKQLLPDLLVMGRRKEKFVYLLHLLFPSRKWLEHYYNLLPPSWFLHFYHPLRLLLIYTIETFSFIFSLFYIKADIADRT